ncbi:MAG: glycosyltransferase [Lentisphaeria bacterium]|nr:glycosyltransferase [Lentisphaeria bacterium]
MKIAIVIPTLNAVRRGCWEKLLASVEKQDIQNCQKFIVDSSSGDATCEMAGQYHWKCIRITASRYDHGGTKDRICRILYKKGFDTVVFLSQDAVPVSENSIRLLTEYLWDNDIAGCFGKQVTEEKYSFDAWQKKQYYPESSYIKTAKNFANAGGKSAFFSNAFSAWKIGEVVRYGSFPHTRFGEDVLLASRILSDGGSIGYCAGAVVIHQHPETVNMLFLRGFQVGQFHQLHPEIGKFFKYCPDQKKIISFPPLRLFLPFGIKLLGYIAGRVPDYFFPVAAFVLIWFLALPVFLMPDLPARDVVNRYAPMAEAFAAGDWSFAFHPRIPPLLPVCAGIITKIFSCEAFAALKLASCLFFSMGVFPLWWGCRKMYGMNIALLSILLYSANASLLRITFSALRESGNIFGLLLLFCASAFLKENRKSTSGLFFFVSGIFLLLVNRGDTALFVFLSMCIFFIWDIVKNHIPWRTFFTGALILLLLSPLLLYNYNKIGYFVPEIRHGILLEKLIEKYSFFDFLYNDNAEIRLKGGRPAGGQKK